MTACGNSTPRYRPAGFGRARSILGAIQKSRRAGGLPLDRRQRLPEVDRQSTGEDVTVGFLWDFHLPGLLSPTISGEESGWLLRDWRVWGALQSRGVTGGGEGVVGGTARVPAGSRAVSVVSAARPRVFLQKSPRRVRR